MLWGVIRNGLLAVVVGCGLAVTFGVDRFIVDAAFDRFRPADPNAGPLKAQVELRDLNNSLTDPDRALAETVSRKQLEFYSQSFRVPAVMPVRLRLFRDFSQYENHRDATSRVKTKMGYYSRKRREAVVNWNRAYRATIYHEVQHAIAHQLFPRMPRWINEGLSEVFETAGVDRGSMIARRQRSMVRWLNRWKRQNRLPEMKAWLDLSRSEWQAGDKAPIFRNRILSWGVTYFMMSTPGRRGALNRILTDLYWRRVPSPSVAIDKHYAGGLSAFQRDFSGFVSAMPRAIPL